MVKKAFHRNLRTTIKTTSPYIAIAASGAGRCNHRLQFAISSGFGGRKSVGLLVFILYFYFFIGQQFRAGRAVNSTSAAIPVRCAVTFLTLHI